MIHVTAGGRYGGREIAERLVKGGGRARYSRRMCIVLVGLAGLTASFPSASQQWTPSRNVELVVPVAAGGAVDLLARSLQQVWIEHKLLPVSSVIVNRGGAGHAIAYNYLNQHAGNPHVVGIMSSNLLTSHISGRMPVTYRDFTPIALLVTGSYYGLVVKADSPFRTAKELLEALRKNPAVVAVGLASAPGASHHIALGLALQSGGVDVPKVKTVSFNESASLVTALLGGHVEVGMATALNVAPHIEGGKLRVLAISAPKRVAPPFASIPTWAELGYKGTWESWRGLIGTRAMTPEQVAYWESVARRASESAEFRKFVEASELEVSFRGSADVQKWLAVQYDEVRSVMGYLGYAKQ